MKALEKPDRVALSYTGAARAAGGLHLPSKEHPHQHEPHPSGLSRRELPGQGHHPPVVGWGGMLIKVQGQLSCCSLLSSRGVKG